MNHEFITFLKVLLNEYPNVKSFSSENEIDFARIFLANVNKFLYQEDKGTDSEYISVFHKYWEKNHRKILNPKFNSSQIRKVAEVLEAVFANQSEYPDITITTPLNHAGRTHREIANIRFFTAIQDFRISISKSNINPFKKYSNKPEWFNARKIVNNPGIINSLLVYLTVQGSQVDKREKWMLNAANFLLDTCGGNAYKLIEVFSADALTIREALSGPGDIGYSEKKANMFLRDMADWGVWTYKSNYDKIDVASDSNTIRVGLRTGIFGTSIPLLTSYLDVHCYQYSLIDNFTQRAWRKVWEIWQQLPNNHCPPTPASMDYLLYDSIGRKLCKLNKTKCGECIFDEICPDEKRHLKPPRSISIWGATGWERGRTNDGGGGGIMS